MVQRSTRAGLALGSTVAGMVPRTSGGRPDAEVHWGGPLARVHEVCPGAWNLGNEPGPDSMGTGLALESTRAGLAPGPMEWDCC